MNPDDHKPRTRRGHPAPKPGGCAVIVIQRLCSCQARPTPPTVLTCTHVLDNPSTALGPTPEGFAPTKVCPTCSHDLTEGTSPNAHAIHPIDWTCFRLACPTCTEAKGTHPPVAIAGAA